MALIVPIAHTVLIVRIVLTAPMALIVPIAHTVLIVRIALIVVAPPVLLLPFGMEKTLLSKIIFYLNQRTLKEKN
jgi:hypothetical protein